MKSLGRYQEVGYAFHALPNESAVPWYRVVTKEGRVFHGAEGSEGKRQIELLEKEGVEFVNGNVDMEQFQWKKRAF